MAQFTIKVGDTTQQVEGRKFSHTIQGERFWFFHHDAHDRTNQRIVSHLDSGARVCTIDYMVRMAHLGDDTAAAKVALEQLCARVGDARVRSVLAGAPPLKTRPVSPKSTVKES